MYIFFIQKNNRRTEQIYEKYQIQDFIMLSGNDFADRVLQQVQIAPSGFTGKFS